MYTGSKWVLKYLSEFLTWLIKIGRVFLPSLNNEAVIHSGDPEVLEVSWGIASLSARAQGWNAGRLLAGPAVAQAAASRGREGFLTGFYDRCSKGNAFREEKAAFSGCTQLRPANLFCGFVFPDASLLILPFGSCWWLGTAFLNLGTLKLSLGWGVSPKQIRVCTFSPRSELHHPRVWQDK